MFPAQTPTHDELERSLRKGRQIRAETVAAGCVSVFAGVARLLGRIADQLRGAQGADHPVPPRWTAVHQRSPRG